MAGAEAYLRASWFHIDPSNRLATNAPTLQTDRQDRQNNGPIAEGEPFYKPGFSFLATICKMVAKKLKPGLVALYDNRLGNGSGPPRGLTIKTRNLLLKLLLVHSKAKIKVNRLLHIQKLSCVRLLTFRKFR